MAIDSVLKRTSIMSMGTPRGVILPYPDGTSDIIERMTFFHIGYVSSILVTTGILDIEHTFDINKTISDTFNVNKVIIDTFDINKIISHTFDINRTITHTFNINKTISNTFKMTG